LYYLHCDFRWQLKYYEEQLKSFAEIDRYCKIRLQRLTDTLKAKDEGVFHDAVEDLEDLPEELLQDSDDDVEDEKKEVTANIRQHQAAPHHHQQEEGASARQAGQCSRDAKYSSLVFQPYNRRRV
jgi:hypothetical protein